MRTSCCTLLFISLQLWIACSFDPSLPQLTSPQLIDASESDDAGYEAVADADIDALETQLCSDQCYNDSMQYCDPSGQLYDCEFGCTESGGAHCLELQPSNGVSMTHLKDVSLGLTLAMDQTMVLDTDARQIDGSDPPTGIEFIHYGNLSVLAVDSLTMAAGSTLRPTGSRALIILSRGDVDISGFIDSSIHRWAQLFWDEERASNFK